MANTRPLDFEKLIRVPNVYGYDVSPDGQTAAVAWDKSGQLEIYLIPTHGRGRPQQITSGPESKLAPRFSPDGARLVFAQDYGGDENFDLFLYDLHTGRTRNLTPDTLETINPDVSWSPDGTRLAFTSNRAGPFAAHILDVETGDMRRVTRHAYSDYTAEWSPDGQRLAVVANTRGQTHWTFVVPAEGGQARPISGPRGPIDALQPRWSPDGKRLAFSSFEPGIYSLFTYHLETEELRQETEATHEATAPDWSPDGRQLAFIWNEDGNERLGLKDLRSGKIRFVSFPEGVHSQPRFGHDGQRLLYVFNGPHHPPDVWAVSLGSNRKSQLTRSLPKTFRASDFVAPQVVRWPSDHLTIAGLLYLPKGFHRSSKARPPAMLYVHGGPTWQFKNEWYVIPQALVHAGCVVLCPNYRGSTGYGRTFQEANRFDLGGGDMRDVVAGARWLVEQGYADPQRIAITGGSYGGYLTMTALTRHPQVFAAGSAVVPFLNWFTEHESEREDLRYWDLENFGDPVKDAGRYREYSPIYFMENIVAPLQMIAGANDPRCPAAETKQAAAALMDLGLPHEVIIYPDEGHGFRKIENRINAYTRRAAFLKRHLGLRDGRPAGSKPATGPAPKTRAPRKRVRRG
jgi:dipeptidyl aminopeptidase/acylaminoacyl peptidase